MAAKEKPTILEVATRTSDKLSIILYAHENGLQALTAKLTEEMKDFINRDKPSNINYGTEEILIAVYDPKIDLLTTFPTTLQIGSNYFGHAKYLSIAKISMEGSGPIEIDEGNEDARFLRQLPPGFQPDPFEGLGLIYALRFIVETIEEIPDVSEICICGDENISVKGNVFRLPTKHYNTFRKTVRRIHSSALNFANSEKRSFLRSELVAPYVPIGSSKPTYQRTFEDLKTILGSAINTQGRNSKPRISSEAAAVRAVKTSAKSLLSDYPDEVFELNREIELVTLEDVISRFKAKLADPKAKEDNWQKFLSNNPFILRLAFGLPAVIFKEQMPVGGWNLDNVGGKLADFVVKTGAVGNLAIVEIKTPKSTLLGKKEYRGGIHAPSVGLSGAVTQVMDQRYHLQRNITMLLGNSPDVTAATYAVGCIVVAGTTPTDETKKKSFELYRNNLSGVTVITFDELLHKLEALHKFLVENPLPDVEDHPLSDEDNDTQNEEDEDEDSEETE